jgi:hypothetical protein
MPRLCRAPGCAAETSSHYSAYCSTHLGRLRRQGDVDQRSVTKTELASYQRLVQARIERNPASPAWDRLDDAWLQIVGHAKGILAAEKQGRVGVRHERIAACEVVTLGDAVSVREVVVCTLAMFVMWEMEPHKFRSNDGFRMQLARRVRRLTEANAAHYFDHIAVYRDPRRGAAKVFGGWLAGTLGGPGVDIDFPASEGRWYHSLGDPRLGDFSGPIPCSKVGPKLD